ncbi:MAG: glycosyl transferase, family 2, partial [Tardiphaga sp.]|nr:glycosyl transferase, family 2 [Tardiphaga sp.]
FVAAVGLRLAAAVIPPRAMAASGRLSDAELPVYSVIVALYREDRSVPQLLNALDALDYPREKLDIILAVEADDVATRFAIRRFGAPHLRVIVAPDVGPRTKPKALNCALPFARGSVIAVFDAEDQPDPGQLRAAIEALRTGGSDVACAQASLCIHNVTDSLFTRMFAAEYAGQFDKVLPGLTEMALPLPLGGTSNLFRADALRAVGGLDAWNVTEDADLGLRLARFGYRAVTFASTTREEAPIRFMPWLKQRSRWMKGWMQTWSVHMRAPIRFWRETGWRGLITLNLIIGANIMGALAYPVFLLAIALETARGGDWILDGLLTPLHFAALAGSLLAAVVIGLCGLARRKRLDVGWIMLLTPVYWACLSLATWRALWQLLREPYRWEKTEHGLTTQPARRIARHRNRFRSAAASSGVRFRLNGAMNLPLRSIR